MICMLHCRNHLNSGFNARKVKLHSHIVQVTGICLSVKHEAAPSLAAQLSVREATSLSHRR